MTSTLEERRSPQVPDRREAEESHRRGRMFLILALIAAAAAAFALGWWAFNGDDSDDTAGSDQSEQVATPEVADETVENPIVASGFPLGRFVNEDGGGYKVMTFSEDGTFVQNVDGYSVRGTYTVDGDLYTELTNTAQPLAAEATYRWTFDDGQLTFELVGEDTSSHRRSLYTGSTYQGRVFVQTD